jgi:tetratricopeptide (TPR) repeat protein
MNEASQLPVTEEEIDAAEKLRARGDFAGALARMQEMLRRAGDDSTRMLLLFDIISCSTQIEAHAATEDALSELDKLPQPEISRVLANLTRANAESDLGRPGNALNLLDLCIETGYFDRDDFRVHKYQLLFFKGKALERLERWNEALEWLEMAHSLFPNEASCGDETTRRTHGWIETEILLNKSRSLYGLSRYEEAYDLANQAYEREEGATKTLSSMYMANCRVTQERYTEALKLYLAIQKELPCRTIREEALKEGMNRCLKGLEKLQMHVRPS